MYAWFVASMWLHLRAATVWIGGLAFVSLVLVPTLRSPGLRPQALLLLRTTGRKFQRIAYASFVTLAVTGAATCISRPAARWPPSRHSGRPRTDECSR